MAPNWSIREPRVILVENRLAIKRLNNLRNVSWITHDLKHHDEMHFTSFVAFPLRPRRRLLNTVAACGWGESTAVNSLDLIGHPSYGILRLIPRTLINKAIPCHLFIAARALYVRKVCAKRFLRVYPRTRFRSFPSSLYVPPAGHYSNDQLSYIIQAFKQVEKVLA